MKLTAELLTEALKDIGLVEHGPARIDKPGAPIASAAPSTWGHAMLQWLEKQTEDEEMEPVRLLTGEEFITHQLDKLRRRLIGSPPNVDMIDFAIASILDDCEEKLHEVLK